MKKLFCFILTTIAILALTACSKTVDSETSMSETEIETGESVPSEENDVVENGEEVLLQHNEEISSEGTSRNESRADILIAYFTWAENTYVENPEEIDVTATTSASVLPPGNAAMLAGWIQEEVGGDLFSIVVAEPYSSDYDECLERAAEEKAENSRPELVNHVENMDDYNIIFLGFPNWWYTVPMAVNTFLEEYDFSGKTIIPCVTHGTGGLSNTIDDITDNLPESATILEPIGVYRQDVASAQPEIKEWIAGLNFNLTEEQ